MTLYFSTQETHLTVPFPASILSTTDKTFYRRYAVSSTRAIDEDADNDIIKEMKNIKQSPHIIKIEEKKVIKK